MKQLDPEFVALLANPTHPSRPPLKQVGDYLVCVETGEGFPIVEGVPQLLPESKLSKSEMEQILNGK